MGFPPVQTTQMRFRWKGGRFLGGAMDIWLQTNSKTKSKTCNSLIPTPNYAIHKSWAKFLILMLRNLCQWSLTMSYLDCWWSLELQWGDELLFYLSEANKQKHKHRRIHLIKPFDRYRSTSSLAWATEQRDIGHCISHWYFSYSNLCVAQYSHRSLQI